MTDTEDVDHCGTASELAFRSTANPKLVKKDGMSRHIVCYAAILFI